MTPGDLRHHCTSPYNKNCTNKSPCEAHGVVRWGSPETPPQKVTEEVNGAEEAE